MTLTEGGAQGIALQVSEALTSLIQVAFVDHSDQERYNDVAHILDTMNKQISQRISNDQLPGDPTKPTNDGPPPVPADDDETPPPPPEG